jgi:alkaline phosphatase D
MSPGTEGWDGYAAARNRIVGAAAQKNVRNVVTLTGDVHGNHAAEVKANFDGPASATRGPELVATSLEQL